MGIEYRTVSSIGLLEIDPRSIYLDNLQEHASFLAPYLVSPGMGTHTPFTLYSSRSGSTYHVFIGHRNSDTRRYNVPRAWHVAEDRVEIVIEQLRRNKGVLDSEWDRLHAVTHGFMYSTPLDVQAQALYTSESLLAKGMAYTPRRHRIAEDNNMKQGLLPDDPAYLMTVNNAALLAEQVLLDYNILDIRCHSRRMLGNVLASCRLLNAQDSRLFDTASKLEIGFSADYHISRSTVLHEIAHALDKRIFGSMSHGPTFVLLYAELLGEYTSLTFEYAFTHFHKTLKVANPIYSASFGELPKAIRGRFITERQMVLREREEALP